MCFCENNFLKIKDFKRDSGYGRYAVEDESGMRSATPDEIMELVRAFLRERETKKGEGE